MSLVCSLIASCAFAGLSAAQTPATDTKTPASTPAAQPKAADAPAQSADKNVMKLQDPTVNYPGPSAETVAQAKQAGYTVKGSGPKTRFCKSETHVGSRFAEENCYSEAQVKGLILRAQEQRDQLKSAIGSSTSSH